MPDTILIVDDDPVQRRLLQGQVERFGYRALVATGGGEALERLGKGATEPVSAVILDLVMPEPDGLAVLAALRDSRSTVPVIVQTARGGIETVVGAMRAGAFDFVVKPVSPERLQTALANALKLGALKEEVTRIRKSGQARLTFADIVCESPGMRQVVRIGEKAAASTIPVLIEGESGVGKEMIARAIQGTSSRRARPFVTVNCGALPENLAESILFGHEKGAFTGASDRHTGKFEEAHGGTLFLDEVGELPPDIQVKLLRAIQEGEIDPVGARKPVRVDIRLISATNRNLGDEVAAGRFREDLFYRLNVLAVTVPPLRERRAEIPQLLHHFLARFAAEEKRERLRGISAAAESMLVAHDWPGNIRQLENAVFRAVVLAEGDMLDVDDFPQIAAQSPGFELPPPQLAAPPLQPSIDEPAADSLPAGFMQVVGSDGHVRRLDRVEADLIRLAIAHYDGRMSEVARRLGIGRSTLYRKLRELGLDIATGPQGAP